jgi:pyruvate kinase
MQPSIRRQRSPKIVATLGPSTSTEQRINALFESGVDVFRLNFSHGSHEDHRQRFDAIRRIEARHSHPIAIMMDLQGPKLRLGSFVEGRVRLEAGQRFRLDLDPAPGNEQRCCLPHPEILAAVNTGSELLIDDGKVRVAVVERHADFLVVAVVTPGEVSNRKGVNVPGTVLPISALTAKDRADLAFGLELGADIVAMSFVQRPEDVAEARRLIGGRAALLSKLEKPSALDQLDEIIALSDMVMVARGDLGVEMPPEDVPVLQRRILRTCRRVGKPVVVATQMLESMIKAPAPTRAEASDVANAIYDGADAVMLSAETAAGDWPLEAVQMMDRIARRVQADSGYMLALQAGRTAPEATDSDAITAAARQTAETLPTAAIVTFTLSGSTTLRAARERPRVPIIGVTTEIGVARRLALVWGVHPVLVHEFGRLSELTERATRVTSQHGFASDGERIVITAGAPFGKAGTTNILRIAQTNAATEG